jgi:hypothetical protein
MSDFGDYLNWWRAGGPFSKRKPDTSADASLSNYVSSVRDTARLNQPKRAARRRKQRYF